MYPDKFCKIILKVTMKEKNEHHGLLGLLTNAKDAVNEITDVAKEVYAMMEHPQDEDKYEDACSNCAKNSISSTTTPGSPSSTTSQSRLAELRSSSSGRRGYEKVPKKLGARRWVQGDKHQMTGQTRAMPSIPTIGRALWAESSSSTTALTCLRPCHL